MAQRIDAYDWSASPLGAKASWPAALRTTVGLMLSSFPLFLLGSLFTGIYMSAQGFYRFAAADTASDAFRPKAISWVMASTAPLEDV